MLFAESSVTEAVSVIVATVGLISTGILLVRQNWNKQKIEEVKQKMDLEEMSDDVIKKKTKEIVEEYTALFISEKKRNEEQRKKYEAVIEKMEKEMKDEIATFNDKLSKVQDDHLRCVKENIEVRGDLKLLKFQVEQLQKISTSTAIPFAAAVIAGMDGIIVDADESIKDILGWRSAELVGKNVDVIIPKDIRGKHHAGFERAKLSGQVRPETWAINSTALHKSGGRVAVTVSLSGYCDDSGKYLVVAQIFHRRVFDVVEPRTGEHVAAFGGSSEQQ